MVVEEGAEARMTVAGVVRLLTELEFPKDYAHFIGMRVSASALSSVRSSTRRSPKHLVPRQCPPQRRKIKRPTFSPGKGWR